MDWHSIDFEPNLKFALELKEDLKTKYFERHEKAKKTLENFNSSLKNIFHEHQKLLADNVELFIINEKLKQIVDAHNHDQQVSALNDKQYSQILGSSKNCKIEILSKQQQSSDRVVDNKLKNVELIAQKENINEFVPIFSSDFNSDMEDENFKNQKSPTCVVVNTSVHNSPILSKRKKYSSRKTNSSISNTSPRSITSSNDSKVSSTNNNNTFETAIHDNDNDSDKESEKETDKKPLKTIENVYLPSTPDNQDRQKDRKVLEVSKSNFGKTEFFNKGKRLRQSTLTLKKVVPIIDITKVESSSNFNEKHNNSRINSEWNETFFNGDLISQNTSLNKQEQSTKKESSKIKNDSLNNLCEINTENQNISANDDDLVEKSPAQSEKSKLRNKLSLNKKSAVNVKSNNINSEKVPDFKSPSEDNKIELESRFTNKTSKKYCVMRNVSDNSQTSCFKQNKLQSDLRLKKQTTTDTHKTFNDDTCFSSDETTFFHKNTIDCEIDQTEFRDEIECYTPPEKKMLLNSFDIIPGRKEKSPDFAYKEAPVRKKSERAQLPGWSCRDCEKWYANLPEEERRKKQNECSKHRGKYKADILTPESFWNPVFDDTSYISSSDDN